MWSPGRVGVGHLPVVVVAAVAAVVVRVALVSLAVVEVVTMDGFYMFPKRRRIRVALVAVWR